MLDHLLSFKCFAASQIERGAEDENNNKDDDVSPNGVDNLRYLWLKVTTPFHAQMVELTCKRNTKIYMVICGQCSLNLFFHLLFTTHICAALF